MNKWQIYEQEKRKLQQTCKTSKEYEEKILVDKVSYVDNLINMLNEYIEKKKTNKQQESKECDPYGL